MNWSNATNRSSKYKRQSYNAAPIPFVSVSLVLLIITCISLISAFYVGVNRRHWNRQDDSFLTARGGITSREDSLGLQPNDSVSKNSNSQFSAHATIHSLQDLSPSELNPQAGKRHMVQPPPSSITLVTCQTTVGFLHIAVHPSWAPLGAQRFLDMVNTKYFSTKVALMRCVKNFICQFGIAGDPSYNKPYTGKNHLEDDPNWLPEGPSFRTNELGVKRFAKGYLAYAGGGKNSRSNQLIVALGNNERLGGGSPWEVPWGEVVGIESFATLDKIYTGYGEKGPSQPRLSNEGSSEGVRKEFPNLDYILGCEVVDSN